MSLHGVQGGEPGGTLGIAARRLHSLGQGRGYSRFFFFPLLITSGAYEARR